MKKKIKSNKNAVSAAGTDTNPRKLYEVEVHRTDYLYTRIRVEAESEDKMRAHTAAISAEIQKALGI